LASPTGKRAALAAKIDAQTSPVVGVEVIAPSPDALICRWGKAFTAPPATQAHTPLGCEGLNVSWAVCFYGISWRRRNGSQIPNAQFPGAGNAYCVDLSLFYLPLKLRLADRNQRVI
jgi:hypothetical protein